MSFYERAASQGQAMPDLCPQQQQERVSAPLELSELKCLFLGGRAFIVVVGGCGSDITAIVVQSSHHRLTGVAIFE